MKMKLENLKNILGIRGAPHPSSRANVYIRLVIHYIILSKNHIYKACKALYSGLPRRNKCLLAMTIILSTSYAQAEIIIRDSEVESVISDAINPIIKAANIGKIKIILLQNDEINAFTGGGNEIFVNTGLLSNFPNVDVFKGVIAHEMGHIIGHHNARMVQNISNQTKIAMASVAIGLATGIASGDPTMLVAGSLAGVDMAEKSILKYSRTYESSADQAAFKLLENSGNSAIGLIKLLQYFQLEHRGTNLNKYLLTHPIFTERLDATSAFLKNSQYKTSTSSSSLQKRFERASYKLFAFTHPKPALALQKISLIKNPEWALYTEAICYLRMSDYPHSIAAIDKLLIMNPNDPYYNELKGQILFEFGKKDAINYFEKAVTIVPNDALMKMNVAIIAWNIYRNNPERLAKYIDYIKSMHRQEPDSITPYYYLSLYYGAMHNEPLSKINLAIYYDRQNDPRAKILARKALEGLKPESPEWYWAKDIIERELE